MAVLELKAAFVANDRSRPLLDGQVVPQGMHLDAVALPPGEIFLRQLKSAEFDVSDMSLASFIISTSKGATDWLAFPVFTMRRFFHTGILVRSDAGIDQPSDLRGKRVGVPEYQQTANVWVRGVLQHEFGVDPRDLIWFMERNPDTSHGGATGFVPPPGIRLSYIPLETNIGKMLLDGELDATTFYVPRGDGIDRSNADLSKRAEIKPLFPDPAAEGRRFYGKTGIYPINHVMVVRRSLAERAPWTVLNLYDAFAAAKSVNAQRRQTLLAPYVDVGLLDPQAVASLERDPMPYGLKETRTTLETICTYLHEQGLSDRVVALEEIFAPATLGL